MAALSARALLVGHFSTIGDIQSLEIVKRILGRANIDYDVAAYSERVRNALGGGALAPEAADSRLYSHLLVICGPCWPGLFQKKNFQFENYSHCVRIGINLTMVLPLSQWNPFDVLLERDSDATSRPDLTFLADMPRVPVIGRCIIDQQNEYGDRQRHRQIIESIDGLISRRALGIVEIDTRWPTTPATDGVARSLGINSTIAGVDVLVTNRLHGLVFALRNAVPVLAIDAVAGRAKVTAQARLLDWPLCLSAEETTPEVLNASLDWCLSEEARASAISCRQRALELLSGIEDEIAAGLARPTTREVHAATPRSKSWRELVRALFHPTG